ncbi:MAG TPA: hypothetical protein VGG49_11975 [Steroidobacteraceae bacterium]
MRQAGTAVGAGMVAGIASLLACPVQAASQGPATELSPDLRPILLLQPPEGPLLLVHLQLGHWIAAPVIRRDGEARRVPLPAPWRTSEADRGFSQALLMQLSHVAANWPWRTLVVSSSEPESDSQLQTLVGQDAVVAVVRDELVDLGGRVEFHATMDLTTVRAIATTHETRTTTQVQYFGRSLLADSAMPRRSRARFVMDGPLDEQVSTAATDLSQFLATIVARVSVPDSLRPHNPTLGELGVRATCGACRASDPVVYQQPGRIWVRVGKSPGSILALPLQSPRPNRGSAPGSHAGRTDRPQAGP